VVFLSGARRVSKRDVALGNEIGGGSSPGAGGPTAVLETTSTERQVTVNLDADKVSLARRGATVTVTLPDGTDVRGRITKVATVAQEEQSGGGDGSTTTVIPVYIRLDRRARPPRLDAAPVSVAFARERRKNVLTVPVTALLALRGGRYAVEAVDGATRRTITVTPGLFAEGYVEIEGRGIHEGMKVVGGE
jgi:multidrug efflux pump subunit AcrA (membrane-fusion protein)